MGNKFFEKNALGGYEVSERYKKTFFFFYGVIVTLVFFLPYLINGKNSVITYHDQLDGEILTYILNAKYLFTGTNVYPEVMNGMSKNAFVSPAPALILLYKFMSPFAAFMISLVFVKITAFASMYFLLVRLFEDKKEVAFYSAILFMAMPFYSVYGLCIPGIPLVLLSFLLLRDKKYVPAIIHVVFYATCSSLALVGFALIILTAAIAVYELAKCKKDASEKGKPLGFIVPIILGITYLIFNMNLVMQILSGESGFVSHKSEVLYQPMPFKQAFAEIFIKGVPYAQSQQIALFPLIFAGIVLAIVCLVKYGKKEEKIQKSAKIFLWILGTAIAIGLVYIILESAPVIALKNKADGILHEFNFTRISWLMPVIWVLAFVSATSLLLDFVKKNVKSEIANKFIIILPLLSLVICLALNVLNSDIKGNVARIIKGGDYHVITWNQFFDEELFRKIDEYTDDDKASYRVASIGIYPAIAAYNGYYCLDAYSNNYDVDYKHEFREIIAGELEKNDYIRQNFDEWGNRCYLMTAESGYYGLFEKEYMDTLSNLDLNYDKMKEMGCRYIFSTHYILNEEDNLSLLNENSVQTDGSWYKIWIYEIK